MSATARSSVHEVLDDRFRTGRCASGDERLETLDSLVMSVAGAPRIRRTR
ncbi:hypothetical protein [Streptomyces enissocaesilis]|uniref:Uncharacterized protein n=1 Tax=Streptomyces enissocaesilis TaxID=332589 RepID=A0ABN3WNP5_9ACTN